MTVSAEHRPAGVPTYRGEVAPSELGRTLMHEHVFVLSPELDGDYPHPEWQPDRAVEEAVTGLTELGRLGIDTVVDLTVPGLGRDVSLVGRVAEQVPVHLVAATGYYTDAVLPPYFRTHGPGRLVGGAEPLTEMFVTDIRDGIASSGVRAGMLKVVTDEPGVTADVERVLVAAADAHVETGVPVTTHSNPHLRTGQDQLRFLTARGVDPRRLIIGHSGDTDDVAHLRELMGTGATVGFDRFGMAHKVDDEASLRTLLELLRLGYADRIILSHDAAYFSRVTPPSWRRVHTPEWRHDHLSRHVLPELLTRGVDQKEIDQMMIENPRRLLSPALAGTPR